MREKGAVVTGAAQICTDEQVLRAVADELRWDARLQPNDIAVTVHDGIVTLAGWVDNYNKRWAAERAVHRIRGVKAVADDIAVRLPLDDQRTDPKIAAEAVHTLEWDTFIPAELLDVTVAGGWVTLRGRVEWEFQRRTAELAVRSLTGVRGVSNRITVRPAATPSPERLQHLVEQALVRSTATDARRIRVEVRGDKVVLSGSVRTWAEREEAERIAWSAPGVTEVENRIAVAV